MRKITTLVIIGFLALNLSVNSQTIQKIDSNAFVGKAKYLKEDLTKFLKKITVYPREGFTNNIEGDVVFSVVIKKDGTSDDFTLVNSDKSVLMGSTLSALRTLDNKWSPAIENGEPVDKKYLIVFRYRIYQNTDPVNYKRDALEFIKKEKYDKAIKTYDKGIKENKYDFDLFEKRSLAKNKVGDEQGVKQDHDTAIKLYGEILTVVDVVMKSVTTRQVIGGATVVGSTRTSSSSEFRPPPVVNTVEGSSVPRGF